MPGEKNVGIGKISIKMSQRGNHSSVEQRMVKIFKGHSLSHMYI